MSQIPAWLQELRKPVQEPKGRVTVLREIAATGKTATIEGVEVPQPAAKMILEVYDNQDMDGQESMAIDLNRDFPTAAKKCISILQGRHLERFLKGIFGDDTEFTLLDAFVLSPPPQKKKKS
jgi:hypothetical protein